MSKEDLESYIDWCIQKYLSYRPRTVHEVSQYALRKINNRTASDRFGGEIPDKAKHSIINDILSDLQKRGILDDVSFTKWYVEERMTFKPRGVARLRFELSQKGVERRIIDEFFDSVEIPEQETILEILQRRFSHEKLSDRKELKRVYGYFARRGFKYGLIKKAIEEYLRKE